VCPLHVFHKEYSIWNNSEIQEVFFLVARTPKADLSAIGSRIRVLRGDVPQEDLADYLYIRQGQLSKIENGKAAPSIDVLILLSERFHRSVDWILRGKIN
jgi:DNA-binding XRE family transcriptional regulator